MIAKSCLDLLGIGCAEETPSQLKLNDVGFQVDVPLEVVHLTDEYWKNVVCMARIK